MELSVLFKRPRPLYLAGERIEGELIIQSRSSDGECAPVQAVTATIRGVALCTFGAAHTEATDKSSNPFGKDFHQGRNRFLHTSLTLLGNWYETGPLHIFPGYHQAVFLNDDHDSSERSFRREENCLGISDLLLKRSLLEMYQTWVVQVFFAELEGENESNHRCIHTAAICCSETSLDASSLMNLDEKQTIQLDMFNEVSEETRKTVQASKILISVENTSVDREEDATSDCGIVLRIHSIDFAAPLPVEGQIFVRLFPLNSDAPGIPKTAVEYRSTPTKIPFCLQLPKHLPSSMKWSDGKEQKASVQYTFSSQIQIDKSEDIIMEKPIHILAHTSAPLSHGPNVAVARRQALTYAPSTWTQTNVEAGYVDLKLCLSQNKVVPGQQVSLAGSSVTNHTCHKIDVALRLNQHVLLVALKGDLVIKHVFNEKHPLTMDHLRQAFRASCSPNETWTMSDKTLLRVPRVPTTVDSTLTNWPMHVKYTCQLVVTMDGRDVVTSTEVPLLISPDNRLSKSLDISEDECGEEHGAPPCLEVVEEESTKVLWKTKIGDSLMNFIPGDGSIELAYDSAHGRGLKESHLEMAVDDGY